MDITNIFRTVYLYGNREIFLTSIRSIKSENKKITMDENRLRNELQLYKNLEDKGFASITSSLIPVVIANSDVETAMIEATKLFQLIRKNVNQHNRIGITLLCHMVFNAENFEEEFSKFTMGDVPKEDESEFQKQKINIILGKKTIIETILDNLGEFEKEQNETLLSQILSLEKVEAQDEQLKSMENYFVKLCRFEVNPPELTANFSIENVLKTPLGQKGKDPLIGIFTILAKDNNKIKIRCKRGDLSLKIKHGNKKTAQTTQIKKTSTEETELKEKREINVSKEELIHNFAIDQLPKHWRNIITKELDQNYFYHLLAQVNVEYENDTIYPQQNHVFEAFKKVDYMDTKVVILGQDPYHGANQANGLSFSVNKEIPAPPSLQNIFKELEREYGVQRTGVDLSDWAEQGVLLLNAVLTVKAANAGSHANRGWEQFTDKMIQELNLREEPLVFLLWGSYAIKKAQNVDKSKHLVLTSPHPSPLSCYRGFLGNDHFIETNKYLRKNQIDEIKWI